MFLVTYLSLLLALCASLSIAVQTISVNGSDFLNPTTGDRFQIIGVAYQPGGSAGYDPASGVDPLSDGSVCLRDAALMQQLGVNAIRVYNVDPDLNHDMCASIFNSVGIYMLIDVNSPLPGQSIDRADPSSSYDLTYLNRTFAVVEAFKSYPNTLLFFAGNEVINDVPTGGPNPPYIRAVTRDLKNYIAKNSARSIPVGYSAADVADVLLDTWNYLQCTTTGDTSDPSRSDLFALNDYEWCGMSSFTTSGYDLLVQEFGNTSVPVFFSEYGCNQPSPRIFTEVPVIYGPLMTPVLSGGLVYEYSEETSDYGLVNINANASVQLLVDFNTLQKQFNTLNVTALQDVKAENTSVVPPTCDASLISGDGFNNSFVLPALPSGVQALIDDGISPKPTGEIVAVTATKVTQQVFDVSGALMVNLAITTLASDESNTPGHSSVVGSSSSTSTSTGTGKSTSTSTSTSTGTASAASPTKTKNVAASIRGDQNAISAMVLLSFAGVILL